MTFRHGERERGLARLAYQTFEPLHLAAYFGPHVEAGRDRIGAGWLSSYTGMRAAPLGPVPSSVVAAVFFGFKPEAVARAWTRVLVGLTTDQLNDIRTDVVDAGLRVALGDLVVDPALARQAARMREVISRAGFGGRPLAAAYAALPWPESPHLALWHATALWREWRGDGHNAVLVGHGIAPLEALVLYDAGLHGTSPQVAAGRDRTTLQPTRRWSDEEWSSTAAALAAQGLLNADTTGYSLTDDGAALRRSVEETTDDAAASVWVGVDDAEELIRGFRPFSKAVISAGILPGTERR